MGIDANVSTNAPLDQRKGDTDMVGAGLKPAPTFLNQDANDFK